MSFIFFSTKIGSCWNNTAARNFFRRSLPPTRVFRESQSSQRVESRPSKWVSNPVSRHISRLTPSSRRFSLGKVGVIFLKLKKQQSTTNLVFSGIYKDIILAHATIGYRRNLKRSYGEYTPVVECMGMASVA